MTRAKKSLTLCRLHVSENAFLTTLAGHPSVLERPEPSYVPEAPLNIHHRFQRASLSDVDLSFPGRAAASEKIHRAIADLQPGHPLKVEKRGGRFYLRTAANTVVGCTSRSFKPLTDTLPQAKVLAIARWYRHKSEPAYQDRIQTDTWDVVIPEFTFPPAQ